MAHECTLENIGEILKQGKEREEKISRILYEFNRMLQRKERSREECYQFLIANQMEIENEYGTDCSFSFLYPEWIFNVEDTYEKHKEAMKKSTERYNKIKNITQDYKDMANESFDEKKDCDCLELREDCQSCLYNLFGSYPCLAGRRKEIDEYLRGDCDGCKCWYDAW